MKKLAFAVLALLLAQASAAAPSVKDLHIKKGCTEPYYYSAARGSRGTINLTGATVTATMENASGTNTFTDRPCVVTSAAKGEWEYRWVAADTATAGTYYIEFKVVRASGTFILPAEFRAKVVVENSY